MKKTRPSQENPMNLLQVVSKNGMNAVSSRYVGPLLGNGEISFNLDENGVMHDYPALPGRPAPRIYWAGRRLSSAKRPMVPFGYFTARPSWEWMESTHWTQALDPRTGMVCTTHRRGSGVETTETALLLDRNLIAIHKRIENMRGSTSLDFRYRLCPPDALRLPDGFAVRGGDTDETGTWLDYELDGVVRHVGRIALWADRPCQAVRKDNELCLTIPLKGDADDVTVYIAFADDLGDEMFYRHTGGLGRYADHPMMVSATQSLHSRPVVKSDPQAIVREMRGWTSGPDGWARVRNQQIASWGDYFKTGWIDLPEARDVQAMWDLGMYLTRTQLTRWSIPVAIHAGCFNGQYFWDAMAGAKALLQAGHWDLVQRMVDHLLSVIPLGMQMVDSIGARQEQATYEGGYFQIQPMGCQIYEVHANGTPPLMAWAWLQYAGMDKRLLERYYPIFWGAAEFFRRWMVYKGPDGKYFTGACVDVNEAVPAVRNGAATVASARGSMELAANVAERLGRDPELVKSWREIAAGLARDARTNTRGVLAAYDGDEGISFTPLEWVKSLFTNGWLKPEDPRVRRTLETWLKECKTAENWGTACSSDPALDVAKMDAKSENPIAWTWMSARSIKVSALIGDGELALKTAAELIRCAGNFGSLYECKCLTDGFVSLPIFVTAHSEFSSVIPMMLVQDEGARIDLLPALPAGWKTFSFQLAVTQRTTVRARVNDGVLVELAMQGPASPRMVSIPKCFKADRLLGPPVSEDGDKQVFQVKVEPVA